MATSFYDLSVASYLQTVQAMAAILEEGSPSAGRGAERPVLRAWPPRPQSLTPL